MENNWFLVIFMVFIGLTAKDILFGWEEKVAKQVDATDSSFKKEIPSVTFKAQPNGPTLKVLYCYSCGYRRAFDEYSTLIADRFPDLHVMGDNYTPGMWKNKLVQLLSVLKLTLIALLMANINPFTLMGVNTPRVWHWMSQHKMYACLMLFFLSNTIESQLMASGAFEIFYNDVPVWSKLATGRIPSPPELFEIIDNQNKLYANQMNLDLHTLPEKLI